MSCLVKESKRLNRSCPDCASAADKHLRLVQHPLGQSPRQWMLQQTAYFVAVVSQQRGAQYVEEYEHFRPPRDTYVITYWTGEGSTATSVGDYRVANWYRSVPDPLNLRVLLRPEQRPRPQGNARNGLTAARA
jgi:hypothetical protein